MAAVTSGENTLLFLITGLISETKLKCSIMDLMVENDLKGNQLFLVIPSRLEQGPYVCKPISVFTVGRGWWGGGGRGSYILVS